VRRVGDWARPRTTYVEGDVDEEDDDDDEDFDVDELADDGEEK